MAKRSMTFVVRFLALVLALGMFPLGAARALDPPDRLALLTMLRQDRFEELERRFRQYRDAYRAGGISDRVIDRAYDAFASADPALEPKLEAWIKALPASAFARMARGVYFLHLGEIARGARPAAETPRESVAAMTELLTKAAMDFRAGLKIDPRMGVAHGSLIAIATLAGKFSAADSLLDEGLEADPRSFAVRERYLLSLAPWRRGLSRWAEFKHGYNRFVFSLRGQPELAEAPEAVHDFIADIEESVAENAALAPLRGFGDYVIAMVVARRGARRKPGRYLKRALKFGNHWLYRQAQGENHYRLGLYGKAVASFNLALRARPQTPRSLDWRARSYVKLKRRKKAFADWDRALALDPRNPEILIQKAAALRQSKRFDDVIAALDKAMTYGAREDRVWAARGHLYLHDLKRPDDSVSDLQRAARISPNRPGYWYHYGLALHRTGQCEAAEPLKTYRNLCKAGAKCGRKELAWATKTVTRLQDPQTCPTPDASYKG